MNILRHFLFIIALLAPIPALADFQAGLIALLNRDYPTALKMFKPLADKGNPAAQVNLGNLYMKGLGVEQNYPLARHWYLKAAEQGERMAQSKLGIINYYGMGVDKNPVEAASWFQKAAQLGDTSAQTALGSLYAAGDGVAKNLALAFYWYTMAEEQGNKEAAKGRKSLEEELTPGERDEALRLMSETRKQRAEQDQKAFEAATAGLGTPPGQTATEPAAESSDKPIETLRKTKKKAEQQKPIEKKSKQLTHTHDPMLKPDTEQATTTPKKNTKIQKKKKTLP